MADEIVYRELKAGEVIQPGDEWQTESGRWALFHESMLNQTSALRSRRPYNITQLAKEQREASEAVTIWQRAGQAAIKERDQARAAMQDAHRECDSLRKERDRLAIQMNELLKQKQYLTGELARLQQPSPPTDHIADVNKIVESELERMAWELWLRGDDSIEGAWRKAEHFITERNRRRQVQRENDATTAGTAGDPS